MKEDPKWCRKGRQGKGARKIGRYLCHVSPNLKQNHRAGWITLDNRIHVATSGFLHPWAGPHDENDIIAAVLLHKLA